METEMNIIDHTAGGGFENVDYGFDESFGQFDATGASDTQYRPAIVTKIDDGRAHPCNECGTYPSVHDVFFKDKVAHPNHYYISCDTCDNCDGEWFATEEEVIAAWNSANPLEKVEVDENLAESRKFADEIVRQTRFLD